MPAQHQRRGVRLQVWVERNGRKQRVARACWLASSEREAGQGVGGGMGSAAPHWVQNIPRAIANTLWGQGVGVVSRTMRVGPCSILLSLLYHLPQGRGKFLHRYLPAIAFYPKGL